MITGGSTNRRTKRTVTTTTGDILRVIQERRSTRVAFNPRHPIERESLRKIVEAARWAPTPHNMQNFEIIMVDDRKLLRKLGRIRSHISKEFLRENYRQLSFSEEELFRKKVGILGANFPPSWRDPAKFEEVAREGLGTPLSQSINGSPALMIVTYDPRKRAPASKVDTLGFMGLGCVMENMWLMAQSLGICVQILSVFGGEATEEAKRILHVPKEMKIAYAIRLGYPIRPPARSFGVRRDARALTHHNLYRTAIRTHSARGR